MNNLLIRVCLNLLAVGCVCFGVSANSAQADLVLTFEGFPLSGSGYYNGPGDFKYNETVSNWWGDEVQAVGSIKVQQVEFSNRQSAFGTWSGFAISNQTDTTTPGYLNPYSSYTGSGAGGSPTYAVAYGYLEVQPTTFIGQSFVFDPNDIAQLNRLPSIYLPANYQAQSVAITNTTYAALAMRDGDGPSKKFGGASGSDPDFFKVSVYGINASSQVLGSRVDFMLADYRFANNSQDYIVNTWQQLDLSSLAGATSLHFNVSSSDVGNFGMNTPGFFALDNLTLTAVPEPSSVVLVLCAGVGFVCRRSKRKMAPTKN